jgi:hypothetical protein
MKHRHDPNRQYKQPLRMTYFLFPPFTAFTGLRCPLPLIRSDLWPSHDGMLQSRRKPRAGHTSPAGLPTEGWPRKGARDSGVGELSNRRPLTLGVGCLVLSCEWEARDRKWGCGYGWGKGLKQRGQHPMGEVLMREIEMSIVCEVFD